MVTCPAELRTRYRQGRVIPFVGAGVSMSVTWDQDGTSTRGPSWSELVDQAARDLGFDDPELLRIRGTDLQILEYYRLKKNEIAPLTNWIVRLMNPPAAAITQSPILTALVGLEKCNVIYTTNYDDFIERSFMIHGRECTAVADEHGMAHRSSGCEIVKFHGDWDHPTRMVLSESDYEERLKLSTAMDYRLKSDLLGRAVLFIGYSFRDPNVSYLFRLIKEQFRSLPGSSSGRRAYIIVADPSDFETQLFEDRNFEVIAVNSLTRTQEIATLLEDLRG